METARTIHTPPRKQFRAGTDIEEAVFLMTSAFQAISQGWPAVYFKPGSLAGSVPVIDLDAMIRDAGSLAVEMQQEITRRTANEKEN